ncbi:Mg2+ transporter protein CorA-like/Zinc transport protein ZntB [Penicillium verhagenii]|uniref:Mg2+ transporter protein CorA-like/Zinc transport protein ZntB n=1 Tax=Penicillium verhagenii TaxID=1562060 RepID=UPI002544DFF0|nr:Mg2+ transporter protein CorA-like/Zinc transport protein ZntB [Penicillium verhagenii]KAJ5924390.1 Mg2+ transporter protein CorA-like/Zinc transport protein ZntB [Penicillium verhagenii]
MEVYTRPTFNHGDNATKTEVYEIIQTELFAKSDDRNHDIATLRFEDKDGLSHPETRWIHFESNPMNWEVFRNEALRLKNISEATKVLIYSLFKHLSQKEKSFIHGKYFDSTAMNLVPKSDTTVDESSGQSSVAFFAFPYMSLQPLKPPSDLVEACHPVRSLLQFQYSFESTTNQDEKQIVLETGESTDVLHVPQAWLLLINDDVILSMSPTNLKELQGEHLTLKKAISSESYSGDSQIRVIDLEGEEYCLPKTQCQTWFEFINMFAGVLGSENPLSRSLYDDSWKEGYDLQSNHETISERNWSEFFKKKKRQDFVIYIRRKLREHDLEPEAEVVQPPAYFPPTQLHSQIPLAQGNIVQGDGVVLPGMPYGSLENQFVHQQGLRPYPFNPPAPHFPQSMPMPPYPFSYEMSPYTKSPYENAYPYPTIYHSNTTDILPAKAENSLTRFTPNQNRYPYCHSNGPSYHPSALENTKALMGTSISKESELLLLSSEGAPGAFLVRHPAVFKRGRTAERGIKREYDKRPTHENAWRKQKQPVRLKDLNGFELVIPWRIGRYWEKMYSVIGAKMNGTPQDWSAFIAGRYSLIGPNGPITPSEWDDKIFPGCKVELKSEVKIGNALRESQMLKLPESSWMKDRSSSQSEGSARTVVPRSANSHSSSRVKSKSVDQLEKIAPEVHVDQQSIHSVASNNLSHGQSVLSSVHRVTSEQSSDPKANPGSRLVPEVDETDDLTEVLVSNVEAQADVENKDEVPKKLRRANSDMQSFVEDGSDDEDFPSVVSKSSHLSLSPSARVDVEVHEREAHTPELELKSSISTASLSKEEIDPVPLQSTQNLSPKALDCDPEQFYQPESKAGSLASKMSEIQKIRVATDVNVWDYLVSDDDENLLVSPRAEDTSVNALDYLIVPQRGTSVDGVNPFVYQNSNDTWTIKSTLSLPDSSKGETTSDSADSLLNPPRSSSLTELSFGGHVSTSTKERLRSKSLLGITEDPQPCPIFAWKGETVDERVIDASDIHARPQVPNHYKAIDSTIRELLKDRDTEALWSVVAHEEEQIAVKNVPDCSRMQLTAQMERIDIELIQQESQELARKQAIWALKQKLISSAVGILDTFVPVFYQDIHQYWVIKKFYGAVMKFADGKFSEDYLEKVEQALSYFHQKLEEIQAGVSQEPAGKTTELFIPKALVDAFSRLIFYVCACTQQSEIRYEQWNFLEMRASKIAQDLRIGRYQLMTMLSTGDYSEAKVFRRVDAQAMVTMVIERLARVPRKMIPVKANPTHGFDLLHVYRGQIERLELQARNSPNVATFDHIQQLREELGILNAVFDQQLQFLEQMGSVWDFNKRSRSEVNQQRISQIRRQISRMKHDLGGLDRLAEKASILVNIYIRGNFDLVPFTN